MLKTMDFSVLDVLKETMDEVDDEDETSDTVHMNDDVDTSKQ